ncbi:MAG: DJ-1/PfpI family protein [Candidatus Micrarchaeia archaeon]
MNKILMIIAPDKFRDEELFEPKNIFESNGYKVEITSKGVKKSTGMLGGNVNIDIDITKVNINNYKAVVFVGGSGASTYFEDKYVLKIAEDAYKKGMIIGAICIAPSILANAGILKGKNATVFPSEKDNLIQKGANYINEGVVVDGKIITASGPKFARKFGEEIIKLLKSE